MVSVRPRVRRQNDVGYSLIELNISVLLVALVLAAIFTLVMGISRDTGDANSRVDLFNEVTPALDIIVKDIRQAELSHAEGDFSRTPVRYLDRDEIIFTVDTSNAHDGPELVHYQTVNCVNEVCDLQITVTAPNPATSTALPKAYDYSGGDTVKQVIAIRDIAQPSTAEPLFVGVDFGGGTRQEDTACDAAVNDFCTFKAVEIRLEATNAHGDSRVFEEFVRLRNVV